MLGFLISSIPEGTIRVTFSFSDPSSFISCKEGFCSVFSIASSCIRSLFVSSTIYCFCLNLEIQRRIYFTLSVAQILLELVRGSKISGPWTKVQFLLSELGWLFTLVFKVLPKSVCWVILPDAYELAEYGCGKDSMSGCFGDGLKDPRQRRGLVHKFHQQKGISAVHHLHIETTDLHFF